VGVMTAVESAVPGPSHREPDAEPDWETLVPRPAEIARQVIIDDPKITVFFNFLSDAEVDHLLELAESRWTRALVGRSYVAKTTDVNTDFVRVESENRTANMCMLLSAETPVVRRIEERVSRVTGYGVNHVERLNMARYHPGQFFKEHHDGDYRPVTVFIYLNNLEEGDEGGETLFPHIGKAIKPIKGMAIMWNNLLENGDEDNRVRHEATAPVKSIKYGVNCFVNRTGLQPGFAWGGPQDG